MNKADTSPSADQKGYLTTDPAYASLFMKRPRYYCPPTNPNGTLAPLVDKQLHIILLPSNYGSSRVGNTNTAGGPAYIHEILEPALKTGGARVTTETIPVGKIVDGVIEANESIFNARKLVRLLSFTRDRVYEAIMEGKTPILLGGDHSSLISTAGTLKATPDPSDPQYSTLVHLLWDGDADYLRDPRNEPHGITQGNAHGRTKSTLEGRGPEPLMEIMDGIPKLRSENNIFLGAQRVDDVEVGYFDETGAVYLGLDALTSQPDTVDAFLTQLVEGKPFHWSFDPDLLPKSELILDPHHKAGAPMAGIQGLSSNLFLRYSRVLGNAKGNLMSMEMSEVASECDRRHGGRVRDIGTDAIVKVLGAGELEYRLGGYNPFGE
ncbi:MAG TPA: arginase family protein [Candidatus Peribacterales bacterium]|nr:arginase family protein [Candidatus Peribacterales bacterium]